MKGQSFSEYMILILAITGALLTMQTFVRRGIQAHLKDTLVKSNLEPDPSKLQDEATGVEVFVNTVENTIQSLDEKLVIKKDEVRYTHSYTIRSEKEY